MHYSLHFSPNNAGKGYLKTWDWWNNESFQRYCPWTPEGGLTGPHMNFKLQELTCWCAYVMAYGHKTQSLWKNSQQKCFVKALAYIMFYENSSNDNACTLKLQAVNLNYLKKLSEWWNLYETDLPVNAIVFSSLSTEISVLIVPCTFTFFPHIFSPYNPEKFIWMLKSLKKSFEGCLWCFTNYQQWKSMSIDFE